MNIQVLDGDNGMINVQTSDGYLLVGGPNEHQLSLQANPANNGHLEVLSNSRFGNPVIPPNQIGGFLGGLIDARDGALARQLTDLDDMAFDFANNVNTILAAGTDLNGTTPGTALFAISPIRAGSARTIDLNAAIRNQPDLLALSADGTVGNNVVALNIGAVETQGFVGPNNEQISDAIANSLYDLADAARDAQESEIETEVVHSEAQNIRDSVLGVSVDEELVKLTEAQRAFQGSARILQTADEILGQIIGLKA